MCAGSPTCKLVGKGSPLVFVDCWVKSLKPYRAKCRSIFKDCKQLYSQHAEGRSKEQQDNSLIDDLGCTAN